MTNTTSCTVICAGVCVGLAATLFASLATGLPYWQERKVGNGRIYVGLWMYCEMGSVGTRVCGDPYDELYTEEDRGYLRVLRVLVVLGTVCSFLTPCIIVFLVLICISDSSRVQCVAGIPAALAVVALFVGVVIYVAKLKTNEYYYHAAFAFVIIGAVLNFIAACLMFSLAFNNDGRVDTRWGYDAGTGIGTASHPLHYRHAQPSTSSIIMVGPRRF